MDLYEFLERKNHKDRPVYQQVVVSGNPGVGKSMFLVYYLLRFAVVLVCLQRVHMQVACCTLHLSVLACMCLVYGLLRVGCHSPGLLAQMHDAHHVADKHHRASLSSSGGQST